jgi:site-specific recombinase XerD
MTTNKPLSQVIQEYLSLVHSSRSENTARTYRNALNIFSEVLNDHDLPTDSTPPTDLPEEAVSWLTAFLKGYAPTTERLYLTAVTGFYEYLAAENLGHYNLPRVRGLIRQRARRPGYRLPQFPYTDIENILDYAISLAIIEADSPEEKLRNLRDRAFLITLADTGLRVHEACNMRRGDIDWNEGKAVIVGKGNREAVVRFSVRSMRVLHDYLSARAVLDGSSGRPLGSNPLFARHDRGAGKKVKPITTTTGRNIVQERVVEALGASASGTITPHSFRHYFVTVVLRASGNLKLAQELARHQSITVTQRYAHLSDDELDKGYFNIFEQDQSKNN